MIIIHAHPEYWTENALINLNKMTQAGTNIAYFGGNGFSLGIFLLLKYSVRWL